MHEGSSISRRTSTTGGAISVTGLLLLVFVFTVAPAQAQRGDAAIGIEIGQPSGVTLLLYSPPGPSWDFLAAWDIDDFFFLNVHALYSRPLGNRGDVHLFYGPGAFIGLRDRGERDDDVVLGISGSIGVGFYIERFEIYGRVTPRLSVVPDTDGDIGAGAGFRFFF